MSSSSTMRAILVKENSAKSADDLYLGEAEKPEPRIGEVLVKVVAFGLNRMDILQREGHYPLPPGASTILGVEFSGKVEKLGPNGGNAPNQSDDTQFKVGDEVFGLAYGGAYAEYISLPIGNVLHKPDKISHIEAAGIMENFITAFQALITLADIKPGENALIHAGASGVGVAANQLARLYGAKNVITTASSEEKLEFLRKMPRGATHGVNYRTQNFADEVDKITEKNGVDVVIDFIGKDYWEKNIAALGRDGRMIILACLSGPTPEKVNLIPILYKRLRIQGSTLRARTPEYQAGLIGRFWRENGAKFSEEDGLKVFVHKVYPWTEIREAHKEMEENKSMGKIIVEIK